VTKALRNPKARLALLAVLVLGGAYFLMRGRTSTPADPTAGLPVAPTTADTSTAAGADTTGISGTTAAPDSSGITQELSAFESSVNDRFGHFQDLENAYGQLKQGVDPFGTLPPPGDGTTGTTGASNPTSDPTAGGDGSPAAPGNAATKGFWWGGKFWRSNQRKAFQSWEQQHGGKTGDRFYAQHPAIEDVFGIAHIPEPPPRNSAGAPSRPAKPAGHTQPGPVAPGKKKKKKNRPHAGGAIQRTTVTRSGATVHTVESPTYSYARSSYSGGSGGGGGYSGGSSGGGARLLAAARSGALPPAPPRYIQNFAAALSAPRPTARFV
jgi:hypothetical protein